MERTDEYACLGLPETWPVRLNSGHLRRDEPINLAADLLDRHLDRDMAGRTAIVCDDGCTTYGELHTRVNRLGHVLINAGVRSGDRVVLRLHKGATLIAAWLAVQKIGAIAVMTAESLRARELAYVLDDASPRACVVEASLLEQARLAVAPLARPPVCLVIGGPAPVGNPAVRSIDAELAAAPVELVPRTRDADAIAVIAYTPGAEGTPRGCCHSGHDILAAIDAYGGGVLACSPDDVIGGPVSCAFAYGLGALLVLPLRFGARVVLTRGRGTTPWLHSIATEAVTLLFCTATFYRLLLRDPELDRARLQSLRICVSAGEQLDVSTFDSWTARTGTTLIDTLGTTEMFHAFLSQRPGRAVRGSLGHAVPGYEIRVVDDQINDVPRGTPGLLAVRGPSGCRYWHNPEAQRQSVRKGWNLTGDVCVLDRDGEVWFRGRADDVIVSAGYNIAAPEIEAVLREHFAVRDATVRPEPDPVRGFIPKAFIVLRDPSAASTALMLALQQHVRDALADYKVPRLFEFREFTAKDAKGINREEREGAHSGN